MQPGALLPYEQSLATGESLDLWTDDGITIPLDVARWLAPADDVDAMVVARCAGQVLDIGCGPGRLLAALAENSLFAVGVDIAETAISLTRGQGLSALHRDIFGPIPGAGRWRTVLLIDGNIGIGGDPAHLLERVAELLSPGGEVLIETHPDPFADEVLRVRFTKAGQPIGPRFPWAHVGLAALYRYAERVGFAVRETWCAGERSFVSLTI